MVYISFIASSHTHLWTIPHDNGKGFLARKDSCLQVVYWSEKVELVKDME